MRVPIPIALLLCLAVVAGFWWHGTRDTDFLKAPSQQKLSLIRAKVKSTEPLADHPLPEPAITKTPSAPAAVTPPKPAADLGDLSQPPTLDEYRQLASKDNAALMEVAGILEKKGHPQRALLAWERVIDSAKTNEAQQLKAIMAIQRLRPTLPDWNSGPEESLEIILHAGTGKKTADLLTPAIEETARKLEQASSGILKVTPIVISGRDDLIAAGPAPVALWFTGVAKDSPSTDVLSFTVEAESNSDEDLQKTVFLLIRGYLARTATHSTPHAMTEDAVPLEALNSHITRLSWHAVGTLLNQAPEPHE